MIVCLIPFLFTLWMSSADSYLSRGLELAAQARYAEAEELLIAGQQLSPEDGRFALELAGIAYRRKDYDSARGHLQEALAVNPADKYAINFLASLYYLDGNQEAAIKYWNRAGKPEIDAVNIRGVLRTDAEILDRALALSPATTLTYNDYTTSQERLELLGVFRGIRLDLTARRDNRFDVEFRGQERNGIGNTKLQSLISILHETPESTVHFDFLNIRGSASNVESLFRWNSFRQRAAASFSAPLRNSPDRKWSIHFDYRDEDWLLPPDSAELNLQRFAMSANLDALTRNHWLFTSSVGVTNRDFTDGGMTSAPPFQQGLSLEYAGALQRSILRIPERRARMDFQGNWTFSKQLTTGEYFGSLESSLFFEWYPHSRTTNHRTSIHFRAGTGLGAVPFDEYFVLGREQDTPLLLRGHVASFNNKKGENPLAESYLLWNFEVDQSLYKNGLLEVMLTPFLDTGKGYDSSGRFGSIWMVDAGIQSKFRLLHLLELKLSFGRDLRAGSGAFYFEISPF